MNRHTIHAAGRRSSWAAVGALAACALAANGAPADRRPAALAAPTKGADGGAGAVREPGADDRAWTSAGRLDALRRAEVWREPPVPIEHATFNDPPGRTPGLLACRFVPRVPGGTTPKFDCTLDDGTVIRVKYGTGPERHGEVAATRLARAIGFGADDVRFVPRLRCHGCPPAPFVTMKAAGALRAGDLVDRVIDYGKSTDFEWVTVERRFPGVAIDTSETEGWAWYELEEARRGADARRRAHIDALHLFAVFLAHWDNKTENQRLVCIDSPTPAAGCTRTLALIQDLGATFGPQKVDIGGWRAAAIWSDRASCRIDMKGLPYGGGTFRPLRVSEAGRQWLLQRLAKLSDLQVTALFEAARFGEAAHGMTRPAPVAEWVKVFKARRQQLADGPACPS